MVKSLTTFLLSIVLLASIVAPTYVSLTEGACEISILKDKGGEDEENQGNESAKDLEVKVYYTHPMALFFGNLETKKRTSFYSKNYSSYQKKLLSPPPEWLL